MAVSALSISGCTCTCMFGVILAAPEALAPVTALSWAPGVETAMSFSPSSALWGRSCACICLHHFAEVPSVGRAGSSLLAYLPFYLLYYCLTISTALSSVRSIVNCSFSDNSLSTILMTSLSRIFSIFAGPNWQVSASL